MYGCVRYKFDKIPQKWYEVVNHGDERGFCEHTCAKSGSLTRLHYYKEGSLTYCGVCRHYGISYYTKRKVNYLTPEEAEQMSEEAQREVGIWMDY